LGCGDRKHTSSQQELESIEKSTTAQFRVEGSSESVGYLSGTLTERDSIRDRLRVEGDTLYFFDEEGKLERQLTVDKLNPLNKLTEGLRVHDYFDAEALYVPPKETVESVSKLATDAYLRSFVLTGEEAKGSHVLVGYDLTLANASGAMLKHYSAFISFDELGHQRFTWQRDRKISLPVVDTTYTYLLFSLLPVETTLNAGVKFQADGFELWDLRDSTLLYRNINNDPNMVVASPVIYSQDNVLGIAYSHPNDRSIVSSAYAFFPKDSELFHWVYTKEEFDRNLELFRKTRRYPTFEEIKQRPSTIKIALDHE
jgi:hypothetical protein